MRNLILFTALLFLTTTTLFAQTTASDDCSTATVVTDLDGTCNSYTYSGTSAGDPYVPGCFPDNGGNPAESVFFTFTAQGGNATISVSGLNSPSVAIVGLSGLAGTDLCNIADVAQYICGNPASGSSVTINNNDLTPGEDYMIVVDFDAFGTFNICVNNPAAPANDQCSAAESITSLDGSCTSGTTLSSTSDSYEPGCWNNSLYDESHTVWYSFTAQGYEATIDINAEASSYPGVSIFSVVSGGDICNSADVVQWDCSSYANGTYTSSSAQVTGYPLTVGETYYVAVTMEDEDDGTFDICIDNPVNPVGDNCYSAAPFCTGTTETFPANTDESVIDNADYDCLLSQANPAWYYLEIATAGDIEITMTNSNSEDIDYILWGPYTDIPNGCSPGIQNASDIQSCSYSTSATEIATISSSQVGEVYIMLITNFSNNATNISFSQTGGTGATDCSIVLPIELESFTLVKVNDQNLLNWSTASELNNDYFTLERSYDATAFESIAIIDGAGTTQTEQFYSFTDRQPHVGATYYRLVQTDYDGQMKYSEILSTQGETVKTILRTYNLMGQVVNSDYSGMVIDLYSDGSTNKRYQY